MPDPMTAEQVAALKQLAIGTECDEFSPLCDSHELLRARVAELDGAINAGVLIAQALDKDRATALTQLAAAEQEREQLRMELADSIFSDKDLTAATEDAERLAEALERRIPKKESGPWHHGFGCRAEGDASANEPCTCGVWDQIDRDLALLAAHRARTEASK